MKARVVILVRDTLSWLDLHSCIVSWLYSKGYSSYRADTDMHKKYRRGDNSKSIKVRYLIFVRYTSSWPVLHNWSIFKIFQTVFKLLSGHENVYGRTYGRTEGCQDHRYIPRIFRSGIKIYRVNHSQAEIWSCPLTRNQTKGCGELNIKSDFRRFDYLIISPAYMPRDI